jgi:hypothetical protein
VRVPRFFLALLAAGTLGVAAVAQGATQLVSNSVFNGGFENGLVGWTVIGETDPCPWKPIVASGTTFVCHAGYGFEEPGPVDGTAFVNVDFDRPTSAAPAEAMLAQRLVIAGRGDSTLRWSDFLSWDLATYGATEPRLVSVQLRDASGTRVLANLYQRQIDPHTSDFGYSGWQAHSVNVTRFAGCDVTLAFVLSMPEVATGPATYSLDAVGIDTRAATTSHSSPGRCG